MTVADIALVNDSLFNTKTTIISDMISSLAINNIEWSGDLAT